MQYGYLTTQWLLNMDFSKQRVLKIFVSIALVSTYYFLVLHANILRYMDEDVIAMESEDFNPVPPEIMICPVSIGSDDISNIQ